MFSGSNVLLAGVWARTDVPDIDDVGRKYLYHCSPLLLAISNSILASF